MKNSASSLEKIDWARVPIFPLQTVFFPRTHLPLHIFEPRYRAMTADCIADGLPMAICLAKPGEDLMGVAEVFPVAGVGVIERHERLADGRYNLVLRGVTRMRIAEEIAHRPYRLVKAEPLADRGGASPDSAERLRTCVSKLTMLIAEEPIAEDVRRRVGAAADAGMLADVASSLFVEDPLVRQAHLEELDVARRVDAVTGSLAELFLRATAARGDGTLQ